MAEIQGIEQKIQLLDIEEDAREKIIQLIEQAKTTEQTQQRTIANMGSMNQLLDGIGGKLLQMVATMLIMRGLSKMWSEARAYAAKYYDQLNEIRIVSGKFTQEVDRLGQSYRKMAKEMRVSSTEIASAAVEFWRQGLSEDKVNERLVATVQYAKISSLEFSKAAELMTAATNSMGLSAERVASVWAYLGDESASG